MLRIGFGEGSILSVEICLVNVKKIQGKAASEGDKNLYKNITCIPKQTFQRMHPHNAKGYLNGSLDK